jgi:glutamyl-tRNA synthetase
MLFKRCYSLLKHSKRLGATRKKPLQPLEPARTRFAPSPTGFLHLGSLRTALYNYLLARATGGQFLLRLEDTDQKRLIEGAERNIYDSLKWCNLTWDEGPLVDGPYGPYRQSDRTKIYAEHIKKLLENGNAYRCFCSKDRLGQLRESAQKLVPPTTVSYDRECAGIPREESDRKAVTETFTIRFRSPNQYPKFNDLLHGELDLQPQINQDDIRYDDQVLIKSDGLPTYHFANVVDDHLMKITHVVRGEEWLPSTPKHIALYKAFGWKAPSFIHIPLLTSSADKKLSKRSGDIDVMNFAKNGILPEALINFVVLLGWSVPKDAKLSSEILKLDQLEKLFSVHELTKGNAKVDYKKLHFFNKHYLHERITNEDQEIIGQAKEILGTRFNSSSVENVIDEETIVKLLKLTSQNLTTIQDVETFSYLLQQIDFKADEHVSDFIDSTNDEQLKITIAILDQFTSEESISNLDKSIKTISNEISKKDIFGSLRFALTGNRAGLKIPAIVDFLGVQEAHNRIVTAVRFLEERTRTD